MITSSHYPNRLIIRGNKALEACLKNHPKAIREIVVSESYAPSLTLHKEFLDQLGITTRTVNSTEITDFAEGPCNDVCALTMRPDLGHARISDFSKWRDSKENIVIANDVLDKSALATIARSMAAFGLKRLLLSGGTEKIAFDPDVWSSSLGTMEQLNLMHAAPLGGLLRLVVDRCCVVAISPDIGRKIDLSIPVRVPGKHLALLISGGSLDPHLQPSVEHCFRFPGLANQPTLSLSEIIPLTFAWYASTPQPRTDGFLARKRARHLKK